MDESKMKEMAKAKKMQWNTEILHRVTAKDVIVDKGTEYVAESMKVRIVKLNDRGMYAIEEGNEITIVQIHEGVYGCACEKFSKSTSSNVLCKHLTHLKLLIDQNKVPQLLISSDDGRWMREQLISIGWSVMDRMLYPHLDSPTAQPEVVKELPPIKEDPPIDEGVTLPPDEPKEEAPDEPKEISRPCIFCEHVERGTDHVKVKQDIAEHIENCSKNPKNKKVPEAHGDVEFDLGDAIDIVSTATAGIIKDTIANIDDPAKKKVTKKTEDQKTSTKEPTVPKKTELSKKTPQPDEISLYDWLNELVEYAVCQVFGESGEGKTGFCRAVAVACADEGKKVIYWDTEGNMTRKQRHEMESHKNIKYILCRDWDEIRHMLPITGEDTKTGPSKYMNTPKLGDCDVAFVDSIGVPVLGEWGDMKQNEQGTALQRMQGLAYRLTKWAEKNESIVILTNQPVSAMNKTKAQIADRPPFGDKMKYFTKEIFKIVIDRKTDFATICKLVTWRTRDARRGKVVATVTISDSGVEVVPV